MRLFLDRLPVIIVLLSIVILGLIIIWMVKMPPKKRYKAWIAIVLTAILFSSLMFLSGSWRRNFYDTYRYDTVEEMVKTCMPGETIDDILYYDKYAIVFLDDSDEQAMNWFSTEKDENGWKGVDKNNITYYRFIITKSEGMFTFMEIDKATSLDLVLFTSFNGHLKNTDVIKDTLGSKYELLELPSGYINYYTFVDIDKPGFDIMINGTSIKVQDKIYNVDLL